MSGLYAANDGIRQAIGDGSGGSIFSRQARRSRARSRDGPQRHGAVRRHVRD